MPNELWPPLSVIRAHLAVGSRESQRVAGEAPLMANVANVANVAEAQGAHARAGASSATADDADRDAGLVLPITELARRREELAARNFGARWLPGRIVSVLHEGHLLGVLLDRQRPDGTWEGFMAVSEADWAGAHDVLLEPDDEPFEPLFGMIQAWNRVTLMPSPQWLARVQGELSATRLAAIRAVHDEFAGGQALDIDPLPGRIALRSTGGGAFSVLSGTPLGPQDERTAYQHLYRDAAARLVASGRSADRAAEAQPSAHDLPHNAGPARAPGPSSAGPGGSASSAAADDDDGLWPRLRRWLGADGWVRPAFAVLALVVVVQNVVPLGPWTGTETDEDAVRFRSVPQVQGYPSADLALQWKDGVRMDEAVHLLQTQNADVVAGPDERGMWFVRVPDATAARAALSASPLVESVGPP